MLQNTVESVSSSASGSALPSKFHKGDKSLNKYQAEIAWPESP
jgi:hypothetical protein